MLGLRTLNLEFCFSFELMYTRNKEYIVFPSPTQKAALVPILAFQYYISSISFSVQQ